MLYVFDPNEEFDDELPKSSLTLREYVQNLPSWEPDLEDTILMFPGFDDRAILDVNPFGFLDFILPQFQEALERLQKNQFALLSTCGEWTPIFLILEPHSEITYLSVLSQIPMPLRDFFALAKSRLRIQSELEINQKLELYNYLASNRANLRPTENASNYQRKIQNIPIDTTTLIKDLEEDIMAGQKFFALK